MPNHRKSKHSRAVNWHRGRKHEFHSELLAVGIPVNFIFSLNVSQRDKSDQAMTKDVRCGKSKKLTEVAGSDQEWSV
jgi:hypothetical protein